MHFALPITFHSPPSVPTRAVSSSTPIMRSPFLSCVCQGEDQRLEHDRNGIEMRDDKFRRHNPKPFHGLRQPKTGDPFREDHGARRTTCIDCAPLPRLFAWQSRRAYPSWSRYRCRDCRRRSRSNLHSPAWLHTARSFAESLSMMGSAVTSAPSFLKCSTPMRDQRLTLSSPSCPAAVGRHTTRGFSTLRLASR